MSLDQVGADVLGRVVERWRRSNAGVRDGVSAAQLEAFEAKYGVVLPLEVRKYFMVADGTEQMDDEGLIRFWPLAEIKPVHEEFQSQADSLPHWFVFADHLINSWLYAFELTGERTAITPIRRILDLKAPGEPMCTSLMQFMVQYAADPRSVW